MSVSVLSYYDDYEAELGFEESYEYVEAEMLLNDNDMLNCQKCYSTFTFRNGVMMHMWLHRIGYCNCTQCNNNFEKQEYLDKCKIYMFKQIMVRLV